MKKTTVVENMKTEMNGEVEKSNQVLSIFLKSLMRKASQFSKEIQEEVSALKVENIYTLFNLESEALFVEMKGKNLEFQIGHIKGTAKEVSSTGFLEIPIQAKITSKEKAHLLKELGEMEANFQSFVQRLLKEMNVVLMGEDKWERYEKEVAQENLELFSHKKENFVESVRKETVYSYNHKTLQLNKK